ncbi:large conductance mechanosensitive channel protein MscL [Virgibacillus halodenitrificans]|uniref:Large-conductance mechanosensitive channel n=1 Tax=Virgibacillus halodenitrificans TaxID=1482 RepID=A0AAC9IXG8_VIRHA|nr:large conductance mechanosensitive channel protein MscL [Virgibacillus halodenitrificans]APC47007.1 mechanosensitive ion channel protein MscL [Virgibacillus halodenitrificans]MCJ0930309.1 large conductance mechanosensitive channel protein MscL [Virgibacillus halodenitrificans]MYL59221.1 large conductance mechanosensitive channel protein MscL [Virgibacillus halodenitrificans]CDQ37209.1 Large-conductance mechanosensitive channel [Virgibacillus halodenitrificans]CDQ37377.1 Large-conductance me
MGLFKEFRQFTMRGSAIDMGVGMVLGAAFSGFIDSLVTDILLPPIGLLYSKMNFENLYVSLDGSSYPSLLAAKEAGAVTINYGLFITAVVRFIIILFAVFVVIRQINRWKKPHQHPIDSMMKKECPYCCMPIPIKASICPNCSSTLEKEPERRKSKPPRWRVK